MPAHFNDEDRERIRSLLLGAGRELLPVRGLAKTTIADLVGPAGIAPASFYAFFAAKEELYLELLFADAEDIKRRLLASLDDPGDARRAIGAFLRGVIAEQEGNPLLRRLVRHPEELQALARHLEKSSAATAHKRELSVVPLEDFVERAQSDGRLVAGEPQVLATVLRAVTALPLHADELGAEHFPQALDRIIDLVADGLAAGAEREPP
ncbi:AcrR family transcriptional regulator [Lipingzhangella halophila]|uniref:AcrR family transcriptional regulator n=1 Tax=Lipingzhangella halophila TaxID=1783352 RepID=A0A7W7RG03_9ACTN|nr:TetR/AcrR family transcriptional regulator [Lipingzhangella halophila]MBB4931311.1 AcrR family transcriptional regulator [Lipingzhangella halophila]